MTFDDKQQAVKNIFILCATLEDKYKKIIELGRSLLPYPDHLKTSDRIVEGCQSIVYLDSQLIDGKLYFQAHSEALISAGLAALLIHVYSGETPETILKIAPQYIKDLNIPSTLSPSRSNGLFNMHLRMKQDALKSLQT